MSAPIAVIRDHEDIKKREELYKEIVNDPQILWSMCEQADHTDTWIAELQEAVLNSEGVRACDIFTEARGEYAENMVKLVFGE